MRDNKTLDALETSLRARSDRMKPTALTLTCEQLKSMDRFVFYSPVTVQAADPVDGGSTGTLQVMDGAGRVFFLHAEGTTVPYAGEAA